MNKLVRSSEGVFYVTSRALSHHRETTKQPLRTSSVGIAYRYRSSSTKYRNLDLSELHTFCLSRGVLGTKDLLW